MNNLYIVLGMSRSGTSAVARSLEALGVSLGNQLLTGDERNPKGFFEDTDVLKRINRGLAYALNFEWLSFDSAKTEAILSHPDMQPYKQFAINLLRDRLKTYGDWGFKDPRTVILFPFWRAVLSEVEAKEHYIVVTRYPLATAASVHEFIGQDFEIGLLSWLKHMIAAVEAVAGKPHVVIAYENLLANPRLQLERIHHQLRIEKPLDEKQVTNYADNFIDKRLQHFEPAKYAPALNQAVSVVPLCLDVYDLLLRVASDELTTMSESFQVAWQQIKEKYRVLSPMYDYVESLHRINKEKQREIKHLRHGLSYRLMWPLRLLEDCLRVYRRQKKEAQRIKGDAESA